MNTNELSDVRCVLINPFLAPADLRGELQSIDDEEKHESGMNYGLLVVASALAKRGAQVQIVDLERRKRNWRHTVDEAVAAVDPQWIGVGSISVYSFLPTVEILEHCRATYPGAATVVGGQNAQNFPRLLDRLGKRDLLDFLICGDGEKAVRDVARAIAGSEEPRGPGVHHVAGGQPFVGSFTPRMPLDEESAFLCYDLYPDHRHLWPVIEESRGCPFRCDFCANVLQGGANITYKNPELMMAELRRMFQIYGDVKELPAVLMTSIFGVNPRITREFFSLLQAEDLVPRFVASTRVDLNYEPYLDLVPRYFDQMHFGLETGSLRVVAMMNKAVSPKRYLERATETLRAWHDRGVHTAVNFIVGYLGETRETVEESIQFLQDTSDHIDSVWGGGLMAYPDSPFTRQLDRLAAEHGARVERVSDLCDVLQTYPVSPSATLSYTDVLGYVDSVHDLFYDQARYYHHYKWYVGPRRDLEWPAFVTRDEFERRFVLRR